MKKIGFMAVLVFASMFSLKAQEIASTNRRHNEGKSDRPIPTAQEMADKETQRETKMLNLTPEQIEKVKGINLNYSQQRADLMKEMAGVNDRAAMENKMQGIRLAQDNELKTILTADQQVKLTKAHSEAGKGNKMQNSDWKNHQKGQKTSGVPQGINNN